MNITNEREDGEKMGSKELYRRLIAGKIYTLGGLEEETYLQQVASYLNDKIAGLHRQDGFRKQPEDYQNVMTYLNIADDYFKGERACRTSGGSEGRTGEGDIPPET